MYRRLTKDASVVPNQKALDRLNMLIDSDYIHCEDVIVDLRALNEGRPSQFEKFWSGLGKVLNEYCEAAADSRRHGAATTPLAISIPDLKQRVIESFPEEERSEVLVPSDSAVRLQFLPKNPRARSALNFTGRFEIKYQMQTRSLRHTHVDFRYCAALFSYLKSFAVQHSEHMALFFQDDKHFISIGEPNLPTAALDRGRRVLGHRAHAVAALDHDFTKAKLVPSVTLCCKIPASSDDSFYRGKVVVHVKDGVFSPSSALRHSWELDHILSSVLQTASASKDDSESSSTPFIPPIVAIYSDGGPDHNPCHGSVQLALICLFFKLNLDMLIAM